MNLRQGIAVTVAWVVVAALAAMLGSCGVPKPPPNVPPGEVSCAEACTHVEHDLPLCGTTSVGCLSICQDIARNNPQFPTCMARAQDCEALTVEACQ